MKESSSRPEDAANSLILSSPYYYSSCNSYIKPWFDCVWGWRRQNQWDENEDQRIEWIAGVSSSTVKENEGRKRGYSSGNGIARPIGRGERSVKEAPGSKGAKLGDREYKELHLSKGVGSLSINRQSLVTVLQVIEWRRIHLSASLP